MFAMYFYRHRHAAFESRDGMLSLMLYYMLYYC
jgi:hypothetical protein